jgi:hypothetical protein
MKRKDDNNYLQLFIYLNQSKTIKRKLMRRRRRRTKSNQALFINPKSKDIVELWMLRILITLNGNRDFISSMRGFSCDNLASFLGLDAFIDDSSPPSLCNIIFVAGVRSKLSKRKVGLSFKIYR